MGLYTIIIVHIIVIVKHIAQLGKLIWDVWTRFKKPSKWRGQSLFFRRIRSVVGYGSSCGEWVWVRMGYIYPLYIF